jgi:glycosyltransferase involved in cell wall biosynthesis
MKEARILFIAGSDFTIHPNHRAHHFVRYLEKVAFKVDVIALRRFYSGADRQNGWKRFRQGLEERGGKHIEVLEREKGIQVLIRRLPGRLDFVAQDLWAVTQLKPIKDQVYDICIYGNPDNALVPTLLKRRGQIANLVYDDWDYYAGFEHPWLIRELIQVREIWCASQADLVISVGELLAELRTQQGAKKTVVIENGVNYNLFATAQQKKAHPPTLVYIGKLSDEYGVDVSIRGFAQVCQVVPNARYLIIGYNQDDYARYLQDLTIQTGLDHKVQFVGRQTYEKLPAFLAEADVGVALFRPNDLMKYAFPLKVVEYMAAGLAVVGSRAGETERLIENSQAGFAVDYSEEEFAAKVTQLFQNEDQLNRCAANAAEYSRSFDWQALFDKLMASEPWQTLRGGK